MTENFDFRVAKYYVEKHKSCKQKGVKFSLTLLQVLNMAKAKKCQITGLPLSPETFSIDRLDNSKGYVTGNVVACHRTFNSLKAVVENPNNPLTFENTLKGFLKINQLLEKKNGPIKK